MDTPLVLPIMRHIILPSSTNSRSLSSSSHRPSNDMDTVGNDGEEVVLSQNMSVSDTADLILQATSECSILTSLYTAGGPGTPADPNDPRKSELDGAFGQVEMWITLDGKRVPVGEGDTTGAGEGEVVFCNRAYARRVTDAEDLEDGIDTEDDFIRTRTANAFNWMAFNVGRDQSNGGYDADHDNDLLMELHARYTTTTTDEVEESCGTRQLDSALEPYGKTCAEAFVGSRTLIAEVVHAINNEQTDDGDQ